MGLALHTLTLLKPVIHIVEFKDFLHVTASRILNICNETTHEIGATEESIHFMYRHGSHVPATNKPTQCSCTVSFNEQRPNKPTIAYQDIRLHRQFDGNTCSSAHLSVSTISKLETRHCESAAPVSSFYIRQEEVVDSDVEIKVDHLFDMGSEDDPDMIWLSLKGTDIYTCS